MKKKKKLKKEIKKLKKELKMVIHDATEAFNNQSSRITTLDDKYIKLREDFTRLEQDRNGEDINWFKVKALYIDDIYEQLKILKLRTETDYTQFKPLVDTNKGPDAEREVENGRKD